MRFGVLGRLEIARADGTAISVQGPARRLVLAALLARAGSLVSAATLIEDLWGTAAPRNAIGNLRSHVARLRDDLGRGEDVLSTEGDGYRLRVATDDIDAGRFDRLLAEAGDLADAAAAVDRYDAALALWRDEAYVEFGEAPFAVSERVRLAELRARARERRTELALDLGRAGDVIPELEQRVRSQPYREKGWEQLAVALYRDGRQADALQACRRARSVLVEDLGVDPGPALREIESRILRQDPELVVAIARPSADRGALRGRCPYLGLTGYGESDAAIFVGRERLTSVVAGRLSDHRVVVLTGASGVGKSSLVRAGVVPALRAGAVPGSAGWRIATRTPTTPLRTGEDGRRVDLLVLDQAEELFTTLDPAAAEALAAELAAYVNYADGRLLLVLRSDHYGRLADLPRLAEHAGRATVIVGPMRADELRRALLEPAAAAGLRLESELVETIMEDVAGQPEPLPLLSEAMVRTWHNREDDLLSLAGYRLSGGVAGALEAAAEECYLRLSDDGRVAARRILVRMATPSTAGGWVRRPLARSELSDVGADRAALDALVRSRLVVAADQQIEIAHDALLLHWPRLRDWLDERSVAVDMLDHLGRATAIWRTSGRQDEDLYRGPRLAAAADWQAAHPADVSVEEREFLAASERAAQAELNAARAQLAREAHGRRRLRRVVVALAAVVVLALAGGALALHERSTARHQAHRAAAAALTADASRLATLAGTLPSDQHDVALLLAAEAYELQNSDVSAAGLQTALTEVPTGLDHVFRFPSATTLAHLDHTGRLLAAAGADGTVMVYDVMSGHLVRRLVWSSARQFAVFSHDDRFVAAGGPDGTVVVWDEQTGRVVGAPVRVADGAVHAVFDPADDNRLYVIASGGGLSEWDRSDPSHPHRIARFTPLPAFATVGSAPNLTISADGHFVAAGELHPSSGVAAIWAVPSGRVVRAFSVESIGDFASAGDVLPVGFGADTLLLDARTGSTVATVPGAGGGGQAILSADGTRLAVPSVVGDDDVMTVYDVATRRPVRALQVGGTATAPLGFLPDGRLATSDSDDAELWRLDADRPPIGVQLDTAAQRANATGGANAAPQFLADGRSVLVVIGNGFGPPLETVYDDVTGRPIRNLTAADQGPDVTSPDGRYGVDETADGLVIVNTTSGRRLASLPGLPAGHDDVNAVRWSPDGTMIAAVVGGGLPYVWNVGDPNHPSAPRRITAGLSGVIDDLLFSHDSRRLVVVSSGQQRFSAIDIGSDRAVWTWTLGSGYLRQWVLSPDGRTIAVDSGFTDAGAVTLLSAATGRPIRSIALSTWGGIGYVNHGRWLVVGSNQPTPAARLYNADTLVALGQPMATGDPDQDPISTDADGTRFAGALANDIVPPTFDAPVVWNVDPASWLSDACAIAGRNLTRAEWSQYLPDRPYRSTCPNWPAS